MFSNTISSLSTSQDPEHMDEIMRTLLQKLNNNFNQIDGVLAWYNGAEAIPVCGIQGGEMYAIDSRGGSGYFNSASIVVKSNLDVSMQSILMYTPGLENIDDLSGLSLNVGLELGVETVGTAGYSYNLNNYANDLAPHTISAGFVVPMPGVPSLPIDGYIDLNLTTKQNPIIREAKTDWNKWEFLRTDWY